MYARAVSISPEENSEDGVLIAASGNLGKEATISSNRKRCRFRFKGAKLWDRRNEVILKLRREM